MSWPPIRNQGSYPGANDWDDCWVVATVWSATAFDASVRQPTVPQFRAYAGDPDDGVSDGGSLAEVKRGAKGSWPDIPTVAYDGPFAGFAAAVKANRPASVAVLSSKLPAHLRYGFNGPHQVGVVWDGKNFLLANPLAPNGSQPLPISETALRTAATALPYGGAVRALLFPIRLPDTSTGEPMEAFSIPQYPSIATSKKATKLYTTSDLKTVAADIPAGHTKRYLGHPAGDKAVAIIGHDRSPDIDGKSGLYGRAADWHIRVAP